MTAILATYRDTFSWSPQTMALPEGETLAKMRARMTSLPDDFDEHGVICINGNPAPKALWGAIRPKAPHVTEVTFHMPPRGGGDGDGAKNAFAIVASIALTVVSGGIASGAILGGLTGATVKAGTILGYTLAAGVSYVGSLLISALVAPPSQDIESTTQRDNLAAASASGNVLEPNTPVPRVIGERKVFPPLGVEPFTYFDGPDEVVEAAYILAGPHRIQDIRIGPSSIEGMSGVAYEVREGWEGSPLITLLDRQTRTDPVQSELRGHVVAEDGRTLEDNSGSGSNALPQSQTITTSKDPDEHQLQLTFPQGLADSTAGGQNMRMPIRIRMREVGETTWINLPEVHFQAADLGQIRATVRLLWTDDVDEAPSAASGEGWSEARIFSPAQTNDPPGGGWVANAYFVNTGDQYVNANNLSSTGVTHVVMDRYTCDFLLDPATFPKGRYEVEVIRGCAYRRSNYNPDAYTYSGTVWDFWGYQGTPGKIAQSKQNLIESLYLLRSVSIWEEHPLPSRDVAVIAVSARNRGLDRVSCLAGGWVRDWDGSGWNTWTVTDNPAPHYRDILVGAENNDPVPLDLIDDSGLVEWRQHCINEGYSCNALIENQTVAQAARLVASSGYAQPYMSDIWGVVMDRDRSADSPTQIFTSRNMRGFQWTKAFSRVPDGLRVSYRDSERDYELTQIDVFRDGHSDDSHRVEQVVYEGPVVEADARKRAEYDLAQSEARGTFYSFDASAESILCRRGDLIGVQHDTLTEWAGSARVYDVETDGIGDITALILDGQLPVASYYYMDESPNLADEPNLSLLGLRSGIAIRRSPGTTVSPISGSDGYRIEFDPPISPSGIEDGTLVAVGPMGREYLRLIVFSVDPGPDFEATLTCVDEAPELWN